MGIFVFDIVKAFADGLAASVTAVVGSVVDLTDTTTTSAVNLQNYTIATQTAGYRNPTWVSKYPIADVSYPDALNFGLNLFGNTGAQTAGTAHTHSLANTVNIATSAVFVVPQNSCYGSYITITNPTVMDTFGLYLYKDSGSLNNVFLEVFKEDPITTVLTRITSTNVASSLATTAAYLEVSLPTPLIVQPGERYMARVRNSTTVTGVLGVIGVSASTLSPNVCFTTTGATLTNQTSYTAAQVVTAKAIGGSTIWAMLANANPTASDVSYSDDFNRASFGSLWLLSSSWATQLGITSSMAAYQGSTNGDQQALFIRSCAGDGDRVDFDVTSSSLATTHARCGGFIHANQDLSQMVYLGVTDNAVDIYSGSSAALTSRATIATTGNDGTWSLIYNVGTNTYTAYKNGVAVGLSWTDSGNLVTQGDGYRFGGVRVSRVSSVNAGTVDNWTLRDYS
jgi:hypothetical protein